MPVPGALRSRRQGGRSWRSGGRAVDAAGYHRPVARAAPRTLRDRRDGLPKQFVVELANKPGALAILAETLAARGVDLRAIGGGSIGDSGHVIMTTADDDTTRDVLVEGGYTFVEGEAHPGRGGRPAGRHGAHRAGPRRRGRQHPRPPVPRPMGGPGDVHVRRRRSGQGSPHPGTEGLIARAVARSSIVGAGRHLQDLRTSRPGVRAGHPAAHSRGRGPRATPRYADAPRPDDCPHVPRPHRRGRRTCVGRDAEADLVDEPRVGRRERPHHAPGVHGRHRLDGRRDEGAPGARHVLDPRPRVAAARESATCCTTGATSGRMGRVPRRRAGRSPSAP